MNKDKVIIIGAGASGLIAGRILQKAKIPFIILEATDRVGGRAYTRDEKMNIELGPEFLHGETPLTDQLLDEFHLPWYDFEFDYHVYSDGKLSRMPDFWDRLGEVMGNIQVDAEDIPFQEYLSRFDHHSPFDQKIAKSFVQGFDAADLTEISSKVLSEMKDQVCDPKVRKMRRPLGGYGKLMEKIAHPLWKHIRFSHKVNVIQWSRDSVKVTCHVGEGRVPYALEGKKVIVTSSIGVLQKIKIHPMPAEITNYIQQNEMGHVVKMVAELAPDFFHAFKDNTFPFIASPDMCFTAWWTTTPIHSQLITGWSGGEKARKLEGKSTAEKREIFIQELATISGQCPMKVSNWLIKLHHHNWAHDENFYGAYSYPKVFQGERQEPITEFDETLFFAGEAFHPAFSGTVEGAFTTGKKAAEDIIEKRSMEHRSSARQPQPNV